MLLEERGPWGRDAVIDSPLDVTAAAELRRRARAAGARLLLVRRHGRYEPIGRTVLVAATDLHARWVERLEIGEPSQLFDLDWRALRAGESVGGEAVHKPTFLVCTNGRHDACCAEFGRPLAKALDAAFGEQVWECSHFGGDRFAGNLVCLPDGIYYGRVAPPDGPRLAAAYEGGRLDLDHYRGRSCLPFVAQAAEYLVRERDGLYGVDDVRVCRWEDAGPDRVKVALRVVDRDETAVVEISAAGPPRPLTCGALRPLAPPHYRLT